MKAMLELEKLPDTCSKCMFVKHCSTCMMTWQCTVIPNCSVQTVPSNEIRHPDCPLQRLPEIDEQGLPGEVIRLEKENNELADELEQMKFISHGHWRDAHHYKLMAEDTQKELATLKEKYGDVTEGAK